MERIVERLVEVIKYVDVEKPVLTTRTDIVEKIVEKPVYIERVVEVEKIVEKLVPVEKIIEVEKIVEVPTYHDKIKQVEKIIEIPIEIIKIEQIERIVEVEKIVEKLIKEENCDCLTGVKFINVWNKLFHIEGIGGTECMTEDEFVGLIT